MSITMRVFALVFALALLAPLGALAESAPGECRDGDRDCTVHVFDDADDIEGMIQRPDDGMTIVRRPPRRSSLIRIRTHFIPEIVETAENL